MNARRHFPLILAAAFLFSCSTAPSVSEEALPGVERVVKEVVITSGDPVVMADISIDGMSCEMMCGGAIRKALGQLPGVASTEIEFIEGDVNDHAIVTYDDTKVSDAELVKAIQALHDGQYKVMAVTVTKQKRGPGSTTGEQEHKKEEGAVSATYSPAEVLLPSIVALLTSILRH